MFKNDAGKNSFILLCSSALDYAMQGTKHLCHHNNLAYLTILTAGISVNAKKIHFSIFMKHDWKKVFSHVWIKTLCAFFLWLMSREKQRKYVLFKFHSVNCHLILFKSSWLLQSLLVRGDTVWDVVNPEQAKLLSNKGAHCPLQWPPEWWQSSL